MNKQEFLKKLNSGLQGLPQSDIDERLTFYSEMIDDRIEEGILEADAVLEIGNIDEIISQIKADTPPKSEKVKMSGKKLNALTITFLIIGSPVWLSLLITAVAVIFSVFVAWWSVVISLWAIFASLVASGLASVIAGIGIIVGGKTLIGIAMLGAGFFTVGLSIFLNFGCKEVTKWSALFTKKLVIYFFKRKEEKL